MDGLSEEWINLVSNQQEPGKIADEAVAKEAILGWIRSQQLGAEPAQFAVALRGIRNDYVIADPVSGLYVQGLGELENSVGVVRTLIDLVTK